jgi:hypothetical protein
MDNTTWGPTAKVLNGGVGGALATAVIWLLKQYGNVDLPPEVAAAFTFVLMTVVAYVTPGANPPTGARPSRQ